MLLRAKIGFTIFALYEIIMVVLLHCERICNPILGVMACQDWMRYFVAVVIVPILVFLIWMWVRSIIRARKYRFLHRARGAIIDVFSHVRESINKNVSREDLEKYVTAVAISGLKKYAASHPKFRKALHDILNGDFSLNMDIDEEHKKQHKSKKK